jgi:6-pyruvoyltetrahydropterin/6-carboxytetrahydropterin synthase
MHDLTRRLEFSAAHRLHNQAFSDEENRRLYGVCNNPRGHGHNYVLDVTLRGEVDPETGMVMDLNRLAVLLDEVIFSAVDHKHLDHDVAWLQGRVSTAEVVVAAMWEQLAESLGPLLHRMRLYESAANFVDYYGPSPGTPAS